MVESPRNQRNRPVLALTTAHWLSALGLGLVVTALVTWLILLPVHLEHGEDNPYIGIAMFVVVPALLVLGVVAMPIGLWRARARLRARLAENVDDRPLAMRRLVVFLVVVGLFNLLVGTQVTGRAVHHMETREFCASCHVMEPQFSAFGRSSHAGLQCVDCHVGSGVQGWVKSKMQGTRQLWEVLTDSFDRPIPSGIASGRMVASEETCERCHWTERPAALNLLVSRTYEQDEANTPKTTVLTMHVGGTRMGGIHGAHVTPDVEIRFVAIDPERQDIPVVEYVNSKTGVSRTYVRKGVEAGAYASAERVTMTCIDCHNREGHDFTSPDRALDRALTFGLVAVDLPYLKKEGAELLLEPWTSAEEAEREIPARLEDYYRTEYPDVLSSRAGDVAEAGRVLAALWSANVYPEMGVTWGTYPDNLGHTESPGCFRCHAGEHESSDGEPLTKNCFRCHDASAVGESDPEILKLLGLERPIGEMQHR